MAETEAEEDDDADGVGAVDGLEDGAGVVDGDLCAEGGGEAGDAAEVTVVAGGVSLDTAGVGFAEVGREGLFAEDELIGAGDVFYAGEGVVARVEAEGGFEEIAVFDEVVGEVAGASPGKGGGPIACAGGTVVHQRCGLAVLILGGGESFGTVKMSI